MAVYTHARQITPGHHLRLANGPVEKAAENPHDEDLKYNPLFCVQCSHLSTSNALNPFNYIEGGDPQDTCC